MRETKGGLRLGQLFEHPDRDRLLDRGDEGVRRAPRPRRAAAARTAGRSRRRARPSRRSRVARRDRRCSTSTPIRCDPRSSATGLARLACALVISTAPLATSSRQSSQRSSGVPSLSSSIADTSSALASASAESRTNASTSSRREIAERNLRHAFQARELGQRVGVLAFDLRRLPQGGDDEHWRLRSHAGETREKQQRLAVRPVDVFDHQQQRTQAAEPAHELGDRGLKQVAVDRRVRTRRRRLPSGQGCKRWRDPGDQLAAVADTVGERRRVADTEQEVEPLPQRLVGHRHRRVGGAVTDEHTGGGGLVRELTHEPCLAGARLADQKHRAALAALGTLEQRTRAPRSSLSRPTNGNDGSGTSGPGSGCASFSSGDGGDERCVLNQDRLLQPAQCGARLDPELVERGPRAAVGLERFRLPARAVEREHQLAAQALAVRVARRPAVPARRRDRRVDPATGPPRSAPRARRAADPRAVRPPPARTAPRRTRRAPGRATTPAPRAADPTRARGRYCARRRRGARNAADRSPPGRPPARSPAVA